VLAAAVAAAAFPTAAFAASTQGPAVSCGDTITVNTTLTTDLTCPANGLTIGAPGVVLNLGGHRITGSGTGFGILANSFLVNADNAVIRNGTVTRFAFGIILSGVFDATVKDVRLIGNDRGLFMDHSGRTRGCWVASSAALSAWWRRTAAPTARSAARR